MTVYHTSGSDRFRLAHTGGLPGGTTQTIYVVSHSDRSRDRVMVERVPGTRGPVGRTDVLLLHLWDHGWRVVCQQVFIALPDPDGEEDDPPEEDYAPVLLDVYSAVFGALS